MQKRNFTKRTEYGTVKTILWHPKAREIITGFPEDVRGELGYLLYLLQVGSKLSMPHVRIMKAIGDGVSEIRVRGKDGNFRVFFLVKNERGILVFHAFAKKTQATALQDIELGKKRLRELLEVTNG